MPTNWQSWDGLLGDLPATNPYVAGIPLQFRTGDSPSWTDRPFVDNNSIEYDSSQYTLTYTIAGPIATPLVLTATAEPGDNSWTTALTTDQSDGLPAGTYGWQAQISKSGFRATIAQGELTVLLDLANAGANYDGRTQFEQNLAAARNALATFRASGGRITEYSIGSRHMSFQSDKELLDVIAYWERKVAGEQSIARGGRDRHLYVRFDRVN